MRTFKGPELRKEYRTYALRFPSLEIDFFSSSLARNLRRPKEAELPIGHVRMSPKFSLMISQSFPASGRKVHGYPSHVQEQYELLLRAV